MHKGIDIAGPIGTAIFAAAEGTVTYSTWEDGYGNFLEIGHNGSLTLYAHNSSLLGKSSLVPREERLLAPEGQSVKTVSYQQFCQVVPS